MIKLNKTISFFISTIMIASVSMSSSVSAATKLEVKEGTINDAQAFMNGTYVFEGYKDLNQELSVYFSNGKNDIEIEDVDEIGEKYGMNYINFKDDDVLFNLLTGQPEDNTEDDKIAKIESKFKSSVLKKADRYKDTPYLIQIGKLSQNIFSGVWYEYLVAENDSISNPGKHFTIYINDLGQYIDSSETLNIDYYDKDGKKIKLDTYNDLEKYKNLSIVKEETLLLDAENIYKITAILDIEKALYLLGEQEDGSDEINKLQELLSSGKKNEVAGYILSKCPKAITTYLLKISMEQGDKEDYAYIPKKVVSYESYDLDILNLIEDKENITARVIGSSLYVIKPDLDNKTITADKYNLKRVKDKDSIEGKSLDKRVLKLDDDFDNIQDEDMLDYDIDIQGNLWVLKKGKIQKVVNGNLETVYSVDRYMDKISVFAENSLIVWNTDEEIYSTVGGQITEIDKVEENKESGSETTSKLGWIKEENNAWSYNNADGTKATGWLNDNGVWYYLNNYGIMQTGWIRDGEDWYYLNQLGAMQTGWFKDNNELWYYLQSSGKMAYDTIIDGYKLSSNGYWIN